MGARVPERRVVIIRAIRTDAGAGGWTFEILEVGRGEPDRVLAHARDGEALVSALRTWVASLVGDPPAPETSA